MSDWGTILRNVLILLLLAFSIIDGVRIKALQIRVEAIEKQLHSTGGPHAG